MTLEAKGMIASAGLLVGGGVGGGVLRSLVPALVGAALSLLIGWFWFVRNAKVKAREILATAAQGRDLRIAELEKAQGISAAVLEMLRKELTHYHTPELDALMLVPFAKLTDEQRARMVVLLEERSRDHSAEIPPAEREAAQLYPLMVKRAKVEAETLKGGKQLQTVAVTQTEPNGET